MDLQQLKGINAKFLTTYVKGVPFINGIKVCESMAKNFGRGARETVAAISYLRNKHGD